MSEEEVGCDAIQSRGNFHLTSAPAAFQDARNATRLLRATKPTCTALLSTATFNAAFFHFASLFYESSPRRSRLTNTRGEEPRSARLRKRLPCFTRALHPFASAETEVGVIASCTSHEDVSAVKTEKRREYFIAI